MSDFFDTSKDDVKEEEVIEEEIEKLADDVVDDVPNDTEPATEEVETPEVSKDPELTPWIAKEDKVVEEFPAAHGPIAEEEPEPEPEPEPEVAVEPPPDPGPSPFEALLTEKRKDRVIIGVKNITDKKMKDVIFEISTSDCESIRARKVTLRSGDVKQIAYKIPEGYSGIIHVKHGAYITSLEV
tara:strand:+ start:153 stop:704 length:552 start_codon:yes stop_codon:yes gene_type:complete